ncbi:GAF modulated sigma54 specific transcriptional regulator, Fis family [Ancylobacter novellus DSM 506]|uniref:GAF modulated sigma54 specific transcriptional regulator, Fis family n=1 Tax=Ancylobacter novellus (strain ATCC 8093 / DSM 506 / JCM 20403 / CCM 1077 / IAM 12100 / NBRC 12443 / NCIMB 10456) TaxID=639283 RepID=D7A3F0_ANCN5|nr:sigma-54-dependent Fis family transcriptional regulator [Ancylobacter novellus]ADH89709.1 GAF modulated sigma54 specific transcriptional regulator, Fis family [Ancylobacter novellus DSM 506]
MRPDASPRSVLAARKQFFQHGRPDRPLDGLVPEPILRSWQRCAARGLDNAALPRLEPLTAHELSAITERHERLRRLCRPEIESLYADAMQTGCVVILTDADGLILDALGNADFAARAAQVALRPGVMWGESSTGTNAVGTALVEGRPIAVHGGEHYYDPHGILSCSAAPILDPYGQTVGALDLSGPAAVDHRHALGLVRLAVAQIEHRFFDEDFAGRRILRLQADRALLGTAREGVLVFEEDRLVAANRAGLGLVGADWSALGAARADELLERLPRADGQTHALRDGAGRPLFCRLDGPPPSRMIGVLAPPARREQGPLFAPTEREAIARAVRMVEADVPVLIRGETGTGKELAAREIHRLSTRAGGPFVAVNCAAVPETLIESELFGYEEGAFTGARRHGRKGLLREAQGGVLFLDEIGDMPLSLQSRLLRVLQDREVAPLGGGRPVKVDFALLCATHRDLTALVEAGSFRQDLYFRIAHYTVALPPLRALPDRAGIVRELWRQLVDDERLTLTEGCAARLAGHGWPGNFRQLAGTLRALAALAEPYRPVEEAMLPPEIGTAPVSASPSASDTTLDALTVEAMRRTLEACGGNVSLAARRLGINRSTLYRRLFHA